MQIVDVEFRVRPFAAASQGVTARVVRDAPLACMTHGGMTTRFHRWHGRSGARYVTTVYPVDREAPADALPDLGPAVLIAVARRGGDRAIIGLAAIERDSDWGHATARLQAGADEWHVHLLARDRASRAAVVTDLGASQRMAIVA